MKLLKYILIFYILNHFYTIGPRTNNNIEGYNNKLKLFVGAANPNIYKILEIFKNEETSADKSFRQACQIPPYKPTPRKNFVDKDVKFKLLKNLVIDKWISLENYLTQIIDLYKFEKKKINPVTDTSESDEISGTSGDSSSSSDENEVEIPQITQIVVPLIEVNNQTYFNL